MPTKSNVKTITVTQDEVIARLGEYMANDPAVCFAIMFGSHVNKSQKQAKDIDVAIYFYKAPKGLELLRIINRLSNLTRRNVDLIVLNTASAFLRHQVMKTGVPIIVKDDQTYRQFRENVLSDYDEYKSISGMDRYDR